MSISIADRRPSCKHPVDSFWQKRFCRTCGRENAREIRQYIDDLNDRLSAGEKEGCCENATVNAVLAAYIGKAKQQDVRVMVNAGITQKLPMDSDLLQ